MTTPAFCAFCRNRGMRNKGPAKPGGPVRWLCLSCRKYQPAPPRARLRLVAHEEGWLLAVGTRGMPVTVDGRHRRIVTLGKGHPYANSGGWQYLSRFLVMDALGRRLSKEEQVHHKDGNRLLDLLSNYDLMTARLHGCVGCEAASIAGWRDELGRFVKWDASIFEQMDPEEFEDLIRPGEIDRYGPIVGDAAARLLSGRAQGGIDKPVELPFYIPSPASRLPVALVW